MTMDLSIFRPENALEIGKAAEHLVCADLILSGYRGFLSDQGLPYDVVIDIAGRLLRVQVKATSEPKVVTSSKRSPVVAYSFNARRKGKGATKRLSNWDCDLIALVALDIKAVAYFPVFEVGMTCQLLPPGHVIKGNTFRKRGNFDQFPIDQAVERLVANRGDLPIVPYRGGEQITLGDRSMSIIEWSREMGLSVGAIESRLAGGWSVEDALTVKAEAGNRNPANLVEWKGEAKTLNAWARELGFARPSLARRLREGWSIERAFTTPSKKDRHIEEDQNELAL